MDPSVVAALKSLTDATRLRIVGRLAAGPATVQQLAGELELPVAIVVRQVSLLRRAGVVAASVRAGEGYTLRIDTLQGLGRALDDRDRTFDDPSVAPDDARVLHGYLENGRLTTIPAQTGKRLVVLRWLVDQVFTEDREYPEKEVNQRLALFHPDVAALRRYMVDARLATREHGLYRRAAAPASPAVGP